MILSSGIVAMEKIESDLLEDEVKGDEQMKNFIEKRIVDQTIDFYEHIKRLYLRTFSSLKKVKVKLTIKSSSSVLKATYLERFC